MMLLKTTFRINVRILSLVGFFFLLGCSNLEDTPPEKTALWYSQEKGYILERTGENVKLYGSSTAGCTLIDDQLISANYAGIQFNEHGDQLIGSSALLSTNINFTRITQADYFCDLKNLTQTDDPHVNFQYFWDIFNDYYAFFELRNVNWQDQLALASQVNSTNLNAILEGMIVPLKDGHVSIFNDDININSNRSHLLELINEHLSSNQTIGDTDELIATLNARISFINSNYLGNNNNSDSNGNMVWGLLNDRVGYFNIISMEDYAADITQELSTVDQLMNQIMQDINNANIDKLIIDLRFNTGGYDGISLEIAARFISISSHVFTVKSKYGANFTAEQTFTLSPKGDFPFTGDIVVLTSPVTASAAEVFLLCVKDLPNVTIVGQATNGAFSDILTHRLPNGTFVGLSNQIYTDASGKSFEAIGIGPMQENEIPFFSTYDFNYAIDSAIEKGLEILQ